MHRIEGLAERFIYCNDDFLFLKPMCASDFYGDSAEYGHFSIPRALVQNLTDIPRHKALARVRLAVMSLFERTGVTEAEAAEAPGKLVLDHMPYVLRKSFIEEVQHEWPSVFARVGQSSCRDGAVSETTDSPPWIYNWYNVDRKGTEASPRVLGHVRWAYGAEYLVDADVAECSGARAEANVPSVQQYLRQLAHMESVWVLALNDDFAIGCPRSNASIYARQAAAVRKYLDSVTPRDAGEADMSACRECVDFVKAC